MTDIPTAAAHHDAAAAHHEHAAACHREASRHFQTGKDFGIAAHQAMLAHGHALHAVRQGDEARSLYAPHHLSTWTPPADPGADGSKSGESVPSAIVPRHAAAERYHTQAALHHKQAAMLFIERQYARAAHEAQMATRHAHHSIFHEDEAALHYIEHYGKSGQSAEII